ncbi:MAG: hypothetical protein KJZ75_16175 [Hyphomonadaceae bacterium]|nr:hypothetical protein [Hyphomonadaceae bacterium]GIK50144.1 MAG: hypothetical protein BroJett013_28410 [Alphaproteobacteria bacterium]
MQDEPRAPEIIGVVRTFLQERIAPCLEGREAFDLRVAVRALELVERELAIAPRAHHEEAQRLEKLLGASGSLGELNRRLIEFIATDADPLGNAALMRHLWKTTADKLAVDQPRYAAFVASQAHIESLIAQEARTEREER